MTSIAPVSQFANDPYTQYAPKPPAFQGPPGATGAPTNAPKGPTGAPSGPAYPNVMPVAPTMPAQPGPPGGYDPLAFQPPTGGAMDAGGSIPRPAPQANMAAPFTPNATPTAAPTNPYTPTLTQKDAPPPSEDWFARTGGVRPDGSVAPASNGVDYWALTTDAVAPQYRITPEEAAYKTKQMQDPAYQRYLAAASQTGDPPPWMDEAQQAQWRTQHAAELEQMRTQGLQIPAYTPPPEPENVWQFPDIAKDNNLVLAGEKPPPPNLGNITSGDNGYGPAVPPPGGYGGEHGAVAPPESGGIHFPGDVPPIQGSGPPAHIPEGPIEYTPPDETPVDRWTGASDGLSPNVSPTDPDNDLRSMQITPGNLLDRFKLAQDKYGTFASGTNPQYQAALRDATRAAAGAGRLGSGMLRTSFGDLGNTRAQSLQNERDRLFQGALEGSVQDAQTQFEDLMKEQGYQLNSQGQAFNQAVTAQELQEKLKSGEFNRALAQMIQGNANDPSSMQQWMSTQMGNQASAANQAMAQLFSSIASGKSGGDTDWAKVWEQIKRWMPGGGGAGDQTLPGQEVQ